MYFLIGLFVIMLILFCYVKKLTTKKVSFNVVDDVCPYKYTHINDDKLPTIVILAGIHGNEYGASKYLSQHCDPARLSRSYNYIIYPRINPWGLDNNIRTTEDGVDLNRMWPDKHSVTKYIWKDIKNANMVIDFHEGWGFNTCNESSMGNSLYTNNDFMKEQLQSEIIPLLNHHSKNTNIPTECQGWTLNNDLPYLNGALDIYCKNIPYVLVEIAGQNNNHVTELDRMECAKIIIQNIF